MESQEETREIRERLVKLETVLATERKWFMVTGTVLLAILGYTNFVTIPGEARKVVDSRMPPAAELAIERWVKENDGVLVLEKLALLSQKAEAAAESTSAAERLALESYSTAKSIADRLATGSLSSTGICHFTFREADMRESENINATLGSSCKSWLASIELVRRRAYANFKPDTFGSNAVCFVHSTRLPGTGSSFRGPDEDSRRVEFWNPEWGRSGGEKYGDIGKVALICLEAVRSPL